jgi:hypothetical protein
MGEKRTLILYVNGKDLSRETSAFLEAAAKRPEKTL